MTGDAYFAGLSLGAVVFACTAVFLAALVRGYSGFGLSALMVTSLALVIPPVEVVPMAMALEVVASLTMRRRVWHDVSWRETGLLLIAAAIGTPFGLWLLTALPADLMRVVISLIVLCACLGIWFGIKFRGLESRGALETSPGSWSGPRPRYPKSVKSLVSYIALARTGFANQTRRN